MKFYTVGKLAIIAVAAALAIPAYAGIAAPGTDSDSAFAGISGGAGNAGDVDVVLNGPASSDVVVGKSAVVTEEYDSNAKSLSAFSSSSTAKHGGDWNWPGDGGDGGCGGTVVPEPSTMALLGLGLGAMAVRRRTATK